MLFTCTKDTAIGRRLRQFSIKVMSLENDNQHSAKRGISVNFFAFTTIFHSSCRLRLTETRRGTKARRKGLMSMTKADPTYAAEWKTRSGDSPLLAKARPQLAYPA